MKQPPAWYDSNADNPPWIKALAGWAYVIGLVFGIVCAIGLSGVVASMLYGVSATDPLTFLFITLLLAAVALSACYIPARRATKVDPVIAIRSL